MKMFEYDSEWERAAARSHVPTTLNDLITLLSYMKTKRDYNVVIERDSDGYYVASVPSLPGCYTQAKSLDTLMKRIQEAIELCLEVEQADEEELDFIGVQKVSVAV